VAQHPLHRLKAVSLQDGDPFRQDRVRSHAFRAKATVHPYLDAMALIVEMASPPPSVTVQVGAAHRTGQRSENMMFRMFLSFTY